MIHYRLPFQCCAPLAVAVLTFGCATGSPPATPEPIMIVDTVMQVDTVEVMVESGSPELEQRVARLELQILERDAQLGDLQQQLDGARQEVVRGMAKLQSQATRAEAASGLAEAEIALQTLGGRAGGSASSEAAQARQLLEQSTAEFDNENYAGGLYLATQARTLARAGDARLRGGGGAELQPGEVLFAVPVALRTRTRSNVRDGPGTGFSVLFTLEASSEIVGRAYTTQWVRITDTQGREGWIHQSLVESRTQP